MNPIIQEAMKNQAIINIGVIGHVANGKSTIVRNITGTETQRHSGEQTTGLTIRNGYANAKIYKCNNTNCKLYKDFSELNESNE